MHEPGGSLQVNGVVIDLTAETLRPAGFPACAAPELPAQFEKPQRLPECETKADAGGPAGEAT
jgi:hypothetical protein